MRELVRYYRPAILYSAALFAVVALIVTTHVLTRPPSGTESSGRDAAE